MPFVFFKGQKGASVASAEFRGRKVSKKWEQGENGMRACRGRELCRVLQAYHCKLIVLFFEVMRNHWSASVEEWHGSICIQKELLRLYDENTLWWARGGTERTLRGYLRTRVREDKETFPVMAMEVARTSRHFYYVEIGDNTICCLIECEEWEREKLTACRFSVWSCQPLRWETLQLSRFGVKLVRIPILKQ